MHYLGLDHIGHKAGPRSPYMLPKQQEMDDIVRKIYTAIESQPHLESTLFVLAGDHGMNDAGNHGGSAPGETSPALLLMSPKFGRAFPGRVECPALPKEGEFDFYTTVEQSDVVPTLAGLLGFPVPKNNLGVFIPALLELWDGMSLIYPLSAIKNQVATVDEEKRVIGLNSCYGTPNNCWRLFKQHTRISATKASLLIARQRAPTSTNWLVGGGKL